MRSGLLALAALAFTATEGLAQTIQLAPMVGYRTGGGFSGAFDGKRYDLVAASTYAGAVDLRVSPNWRLELAYSRNPTELQGPVQPNRGVTVEHWLVGLQEERGAEEKARYRWFGTFLVGANRFVPAFNADPEIHLAGGFALGVKGFLSKNFGFRIEGRAIMTLTSAEGDTLCGAGTCYFAYDGSTFWQWEGLGGLFLAF